MCWNRIGRVSGNIDIINLGQIFVLPKKTLGNCTNRNSSKNNSLVGILSAKEGLRPSARHHQSYIVELVGEKIRYLVGWFRTVRWPRMNIIRMLARKLTRRSFKFKRYTPECVLTHLFSVWHVHPINFILFRQKFLNHAYLIELWRFPAKLTSTHLNHYYIGGVIKCQNERLWKQRTHYGLENGSIVFFFFLRLFISSNEVCNTAYAL